MAEDRVQKILARAGYGSRRASEDLITSGRVRINGVIAVLGSKADPARDTITVDNQPIAKEQAPVYIALNKPHGILSEVSPEEPRETVRDLIPIPGHMFIVGRLDLESEGLILLTNDGELANRLTHPRYGHEKEYRVLVGTRPDEDQMNAWRRGIVLEDGHRTAPAQVRLEGLAGKNAWLRVILNEGRKRQIREMGKLTGLPVLRIIRIRIGSLLLGDLKPGQWRQLRPDEIRALRTARPAASSARPPRRETRRPGFQPAARRGERGEGTTEAVRRGRAEGPRSGERSEGTREIARRGRSEGPRSAERGESTREYPRRGRSESPHSGERGETSREMPRRDRKEGPRSEGERETPREAPRRGSSEGPRTDRSGPGGGRGAGGGRSGERSGGSPASGRSENSWDKPRRNRDDANQRSETPRQAPRRPRVNDSKPPSSPRPNRGGSRRVNRNRS